MEGEIFAKYSLLSCLHQVFPHISAVDRWNFLGCDNWTNCTVKQCKKQSSNPVFAIYSANQPWLPIWLIFYTVLYCTVKLNLSSTVKDSAARKRTRLRISCCFPPDCHPHFSSQLLWLTIRSVCKNTVVPSTFWVSALFIAQSELPARASHRGCHHWAVDWSLTWYESICDNRAETVGKTKLRTGIELALIY